MNKKLHNRSYLKVTRKALRNNLTPAEATLWKYLKGKQLEGRKFRRQHSIENYIVDFYCPLENLIIELDGAIHLDFPQQNYDAERNDRLEKLGFTLLRYENSYVLENVFQLLEDIKQHFKS